MLQLASQNLAGRRILLIESDPLCIAEMTSAIETAGGIVAGCVANGFAAISFVKLHSVDAVVLHTQTLGQIPFPLHEVMASLGVALAPVTSFDDWFDLDEDDEDAEAELQDRQVSLAA